jgi:ribosomal protein S18 acetylase RimI-like enzyme
LTEVRRARAEEVPAVARSIARAFFEDPAYMAMFPDASTRIDRTGRFLETILRVVYLPHNEVWITDDARACAAWAPPRRWHVGLLQTVRLAPLVRIFRAQSIGALRMLDGIQKKHPQTPHHYLAFLGVDPDAQGRGLGGAVLRPVLERCDAERGDAYLESTNPKNHAFYRRQGFVIRDTVPLPSGVTASLMTRTPVGGPA